MTRRLVGAVLALFAMALLATGCGSSKTKTVTVAPTPTATSGSESGSTTESEGGKSACKAPAAKQDTGLPGSFPIPGELTVTKVTKLGPTDVVDGYWTADLDEAYREFKDQVAAAHYKIVFSENEHKDAEISYQGSGRGGQIALRSDCTESGTTRVHITSRPA
jgi:hypothetical protein